MLRELHIHNLAVIEDARVELREGLNAFTGETGAGKSLVIGAFEILLGLRAAGDLLRPGADEARVSGVFELSNPDVLEQIRTLADVEVSGEASGEQLLITRKIFRSGRSSASVNGQPVTMGMLRKIGEFLVDVHGQHAHQFLLRPANQLLMLDRFADCEGVRKRFGEVHGQIKELRERRDALEASRRLREQQLDLYQFQAKEIDDAAPTEGECEELTARHRVLSNLERITREAGQAQQALHESDGAVVDRLQAITSVLRELADLDEQLRPVADEVRGAMDQLQDAAFEIGRYLNRLEVDPAEVRETEERLNTVNRLIQKYGGSGTGGASVDDVLAHRRQIEGEIRRLQSEQDDLEGIEKQIQPLRKELKEVGENLSRRRRDAAAALRPLVEEQLGELGMSGATFQVQFERTATEDADEEAAGPTGFDAVDIHVQTNPGQPARPLRKIASGGELSRIMLALKSIVAQADRISVLVFDEIDANVGGRLGTVIGEKLRRLAKAHQVLCITHLPQIAVYGDQHLRITKAVHDGETRTGVAPLDAEEQVDEIAEMLSGKHTSETTRERAREMLQLARKEDGETTTRPRKPRKRQKSRKA